MKKVRIKNSNGDDLKTADFDISASDHRLLEIFTSFVNDLKENSLVKEGIPATYNFSWNEAQDVVINASIPDAERIDALLMTLRPFILQDERTSFGRIKNILARSSGDELVKQSLASLDEDFSGRSMQSQVVIGVASANQPGGLVVNSEKMLKDWLNGFRFHRDEMSRENIESIYPLMPPDAAVAIFLFLISGKVKAILQLASVIEVILGSRETVLLRVKEKEPRRYRIFIHPQIEILQALGHLLPDQYIQEWKTLSERHRLLDLSNNAGLSLMRVAELLGRQWLSNHLDRSLGDYSYLIRAGKDFRRSALEVCEQGSDVNCKFVVQALVCEDPSSEDHRNPEKALLDRMEREQKGVFKRQKVLRSFSTVESLEEFLNQEPKPLVETEVVPRVAFLHCYWPISKKAMERMKVARREGREFTFQEIEGDDISIAWEIFDESEEEEPSE